MRNDPRSIRIVIHGKAAGRMDVREAVKAARARGHRVEVSVTWEAGDAARLAELAVAAGQAIVVAGGGDGTVNEVATGLMRASSSADCRPAIGILPLGTANDLAHACGIPLDPAEALRLVTDGHPQPIDVGRVQDRVFVNVATGGFGTQVTLETPPELKQHLGGAAYLLTGLSRFTSVRSLPASLHGPGFEWEGAFLVLAIGNGRQAGGGHVLCPNALVNDGLLDVRILPEPKPGDLNRTLAAFLQEGLGAFERIVVKARLPWVEVASADSMNVNLDGEPIAGERLRFEITPGALRMFVPEDSPLLRR